MNRLYTIAMFALVLSGAAFLFQPSQTTGLQGFGMAHAQTAESAEIDTSIVLEKTLGDVNAPLTVIEYASFTCPHCASFHENTYEEFKANYIDTGKVYFIYREVYFDRFGLWAGMVARCGETDRYFAIANLIYQQQATWTKGEDARAVADNLATIGKTAGLTDTEVDACMQNADMAQAMIAVYQENAERDQVQSTPSFIVEGELVPGNQSYPAFAAILDAKLGE